MRSKYRNVRCVRFHPMNNQAKQTMTTPRNQDFGNVARHWRTTRPLPWRLRSLLNQRRRSRR